MEVGDAFAFYMMGCAHSHGRYGLTRDSAKAMALWRKAAKFGYNDIGHAYHYGDGVERDAKIASHYYELAAMEGDSYARGNLGYSEENAGNYDKALKHYMIAVWFYSLS